MKGTFKHKGVTHTYDTSIYIEQREDTKSLILSRSFHFDDEVIAYGFSWDGASSPFTPLARLIAPRYFRNLKASCVHDFLCRKAKNHEERKHADHMYYLFKRYVEKDSKIISRISWLGVRVGALLGIGNNF